MRLAHTILVLLFVAGLTFVENAPQPQLAPPIVPPPPPPIVASPLMASRYELAAEPDRDSLVAWTYDGNLDIVWKLGPVLVQPAGVQQTEAQYDSAIHGKIVLPAGMKPGSYKLDAGRGPEITINVLQPPTRRVWPTPIAVGTDMSMLRAVLASGFLDITLAPGTHHIDQQIILPDWTILRCDGVTFRRTYTGASTANWVMFQPGNRVSIYGATFVHDRQPGAVFYCEGARQSVGLVLGDCTFKRCDLGFWMRQVYIHDCNFVDAGCGIAPTGLYQRCHWTGCLQDPWRWAYADGQVGDGMCQVDCEYRNTTRGRTFGAAADLNDFLGLGTVYWGVCRVGGGAELDLGEGYGKLRRFTFLHTKVLSCVGSIFQIDHTVDGLYARDLYADGGQGILLWSDVSATNVHILDFELRNAGIWCGAKTVATFTDGSVFDFSTGRHNSSFQQTGPIDLGRTVACYSDNPASVLERVRIEPLPGYTAVQGFRVK
jgi:hypothetical protein